MKLLPLDWSTLRLVGFGIRCWLGGIWAGWLWNDALAGHWSTVALVGVAWLALAGWVLVDLIAHHRARTNRVDDGPRNPPTSRDGSSPCTR